MSTERMFPILQPEPGCPSQIPWRWLDDGWAQKNHGRQSLEGLAQRGGLSSCEAVAVIERRPWERMTDAGAKLAAMLKDDVIGQLQRRISELDEIRVRVVEERDALRADKARLNAVLASVHSATDLETARRRAFEGRSA